MGVSICVCGAGFGVCVWLFIFSNNVVLKSLELDSYWALNEGGTDAHLLNDRAGTEAIDKTPYTLAICFQLKRSWNESESACSLFRLFGDGF